MRPIFVSYRREDAEGEAGRLFDDLVSRFGEDSVFLDVAAIEVGRDFRKAIDDSVSTCGVLLAIIGKGWCDAKNEAGERRLDDPSDFVRLETASALKRDIPVIPVLVHGARMPRADQLPDDLKELAYRNGVELTHARWRSDLELLIRALSPFADPKVTAPPAAPIPPKGPEREVTTGRGSNSRRTILASAVGAVVLAVGAFWLWPSQRTVPDLTGITLDEARLKLEGASLALGSKAYQPDSEKPPDTVLSQAPMPNARVKSGTAVDLVVVKRAASVEVPSLKGRPLADAQKALRDLHLTVGQVSQEPNSIVAASTVLDEFPGAGKQVDPGTAIDLVVAQAAAPPVAPAPPNGTGAGSTGSTPSGPIQRTVPDLTGSSLSDATLKLKVASLAVGSAVYQPSSDKNQDTVLSQTPLPNSRVKSGTTVDLVLAQHTSLVEVPPLTGKSLADAVRALRDLHLAVGRISRQPNPSVAQDTVLSESPRAGMKVDPGTAVDLMVAQMQNIAVAGPLPPKGSQTKGPIHNFAGTWQLFAITLNGVSQNVSPQTKNLVITQNGTIVSLGGRDLQIDPSGTIGYQTFAAHDNKSGHEVATADQADLVDTLRWRVEGSTLVYEAIFDYRHPYSNHPPGRDVYIRSYRRIAP